MSDLQSDPHLSIYHVQQKGFTNIVADELRGPSVSRLSAIPAIQSMKRYKLRVVVLSSENEKAATELLVTDATLLADPIVRKKVMLVFPILEPKDIRKLLLFAPSEAPASLDATGSIWTIVCSSKHEADLVRAAWAISGSGSNSGGRIVLLMEEGRRRSTPANTAYAYASWGCDGCMSAELACERAKKISPSRNVRVVTYHPLDSSERDNADADADAIISAPHIASAITPSAQLRRLLAVWGGGGRKDQKSLAMLTAPPLVVMVQEEATEATTAMADQLARVALARDRNGLAWCTYLEHACKMQLIPSLTDLIRQSDAHIRAVVECASPYQISPVPILEQFMSGPGVPVHLVPDHDVDGIFLSSHSGMMVTGTLSSNDVDGVQLSRGDRLTLTKQIRGRQENGTYVVTSPGVLVLPVAVLPGQYSSDLQSNQNSAWSWVFSFLQKDDMSGDIIRSGDTVLWLPTMTYGQAQVKEDGMVTVTISTNLVHSDPRATKLMADWLNPMSICSTDSLATRTVCKQKGGVWDRPCQRDEECPFFRAMETDVGGAVYRGGCNGGGYCEMPISVKLLPGSYRQPDPTSVRGGICACRGTDNTLVAASEACCGGGGGVLLFPLSQFV